MFREKCYPFLQTLQTIFSQLSTLFGTEKISKSTSKVFVTLQAEWITPDAKLASWAGKLLAEDEILQAAAPSPVAAEKAADDAKEAKALDKAFDKELGK